MSAEAQHLWLGRILDGLLFVATLLAIGVAFWQEAPAWLDPTVLVAFVIFFVLRWLISVNRYAYLKANWFDLVLVVLLASPMLRLFRLLRMMRLTPILRVGVFLRANRKRLLNLVIVSQESFPAAMTLVFGFVFVFGTAAYFLEHDVNTQFGNISDGLWWAFVTLTTVGYGDIYPMTSGGRIIAVFTMIFGIAIYSLVVANLTFFVENQGRKRAEEEQQKKTSDE